MELARSQSWLVGSGTASGVLTSISSVYNCQHEDQRQRTHPPRRRRGARLALIFFLAGLFLFFALLLRFAPLYFFALALVLGADLRDFRFVTFRTTRDSLPPERRQGLQHVAFNLRIFRPEKRQEVGEYYT